MKMELLSSWSTDTATTLASGEREILVDWALLNSGISVDFSSLGSSLSWYRTATSHTYKNERMSSMLFYHLLPSVSQNFQQPSLDTVATLEFWSLKYHKQWKSSFQPVRVTREAEWEYRSTMTFQLHRSCYLKGWRNIWLYNYYTLCWLTTPSLSLTWLKLSPLNSTSQSLTSGVNPTHYQ